MRAGAPCRGGMHHRSGLLSLRTLVLGTMPGGGAVLSANQINAAAAAA